MVGLAKPKTKPNRVLWFGWRKITTRYTMNSALYSRSTVFPNIPQISQRDLTHAPLISQCDLSLAPRNFLFL